MGTTRLTSDVIAETVAAVKKHGNVAAAARALKLPENTVRNRYKARNVKPVETEEPVTTRERQRLEDRIANLTNELRAANRGSIERDNLRELVFGLKKARIAPPSWTTVKIAAHSPGMPVLFASDFQWGEVIRSEELDGLNEFNSAVASARYKRLIDTAIDLSFNHMVNPKYPGIYYLRGGDMVSGDIHDELKETNDRSAIPAVKDLVAHEVAGLRKLADKFGRVHVISVPGNHGRTTKKPHAKGYVQANYDTLSAWMLESWFEAAGDTRVTFDTPESGDKLFQIYGYNFVLTHGDRIGSSGGQGFIGPAATITRGMKKLVDYYAALGQRVDYCLVGHFHTRMELEYGFCNGSLPGYSEYAKTFRARPSSAPEQWFFFVHPGHGITARWPIMLEPAPRTLFKEAIK